MTTRIALINPPPKRIRESLHDMPDYPHLGLGYLGASLKKAGFIAKIIDAKLLQYDFHKTLLATEAFKPDLVGITARTFEIKQAARLAKGIKKRMVVPVILGGAHATGDINNVLKDYPIFDGAVIGEGEETLIQLCERLSKSQDLSDLPGFLSRDKAIFIPRPLQEDLGLYPWPDWQDLPLAKRYYLLATRGCPFHCITCIRLLGNSMRKRPVQGIIDELEYLCKIGAREVEFADESMTVDTGFIRQICDEIIKAGLHKRIRWSAQTRFDLLDFSTLVAMKKANCEALILGAESGSKRVLENAKKGIVPAQMIRGTKMIRSAGIIPDINFILGLPGENFLTALKTLLLMIRLNPDRFSLSIAVPYPGTRLNEMAKNRENGLRILTRDPEKYNNQIGGAMENESLSRRSLELLQLAGYTLTFLANFRFLDFFNFAKKHRRDALSFMQNFIFRF